MAATNGKFVLAEIEMAARQAIPIRMIGHSTAKIIGNLQLQERLSQCNLVIGWSLTGGCAGKAMQRGRRPGRHRIRSLWMDIV